MKYPILVARLEPDSDGSTVVRCPAVGWWTGIPALGAMMGPGSRIGTLERLGKRYALELPPSGSGQITGGLPGGRAVALEYGQVLFRLAPSGAPAGPDQQAAAVNSGGLPQGAWAVAAPTEGVFYRGPAPGAEAFVEIGSRVRRGQTIGLVEVMKTFNQIIFDDPLAPQEVEVLEIRARDGEEVCAGEVLVVLG